MSTPDVFVVGSGAAGGMAVYELCRAGLNVLLSEAGRDYSPGTETPMFQTPTQAPLRGTPTPDRGATHLGWSNIGELSPTFPGCSSAAGLQARRPPWSRCSSLELRGADWRVKASCPTSVGKALDVQRRGDLTSGHDPHRTPAPRCANRRAK